MKKSTHPLLAAAFGVCLAQASFASAPAVHSEVQVDQAQVAKGKSHKLKAPRAPKSKGTKNA